MKNKHVYIARNYRSKFDAAGKAKMDCETILENNGWQNIGFKQTWISNNLLGTLISALGVTWALLRLKKGSTVCLQYPFNKFYRYCLWGAQSKACSVLTIVHDVKSLKGKYAFSQKEIDLINRSDKLIVHNGIMKEWFEQKGIKSRMASIQAFDYLHTADDAIAKREVNFDNFRVVFAGNMNSFIYQLDDLPIENFNMVLYGVGYKPEQVKDLNNTLLNYKGCFPADKVIDNIDGDFGLVWYGDAIDTCDGKTGQYLKFNNPHKLSLYLLCDMPIIIWDKAAMAEFVKDNGIGITVSSLEELDDKLSKLSSEQIETMKANVAKIKEQLLKGHYLSSAIQQLA